MADTSISYTCPNCNAPLAYTPGHGEKIKCDFCETEFVTETLEQYFAAREASAAKAQEAAEQKWDTDRAGQDWDPEELAILRAMTCSSCGAEIVCDENTMATECCYCGNPVMVPGRYDKQLKPDLCLPFKITKEIAKESFSKFYKGKWLLPSNFATSSRVEAVQGMYVPYWLFDSDVDAHTEYDATTVRSYTDGDYDVTETDHYQVVREGKMSFSRVPVDGSRKMDDTWMESIEPFHMEEMVPFNTSYMAGFLADKYDVDVKEAAPRADERVQASAEEVLLNSVSGYDSVDLKTSYVSKSNDSVKYAMAPVWILTTKYQNTPYTFVVNGQTGKFVGSLPVDETKAKLYMAAATLITLPVTYQVCKFIVNLFFY